MSESPYRSRIPSPNIKRDLLNSETETSGSSSSLQADTILVAKSTMSDTPYQSKLPIPKSRKNAVSTELLSDANKDLDTESQQLLNTPPNEGLTERPSDKGDSFNPNTSSIGLKSKEEQEVADFAAMANPSDDDSFGHRRSWSGSWSEFAAGLFGPIAPSNEKPPPAPRNKSIEEERNTYHERNSKFLKLAEKQKSKISPPIWNPRSPSPKVSSRKRLESITEDDMTGPGRNNDNDDDDEKDENDDTYSNYGQTHARIGSDEVSVLSNISWFSQASILSTTQAERIANFEKTQQEQFERKKQVMGQKLSSVLDRQPPTEKEKKEFIKEYMDELEKEREALVAQWKAELEAERRELEIPLMVTIYKSFLEPCVESIMPMLATVEVFLANLPLTIGAVGLSWVTMGTVWFKYMEESVDFCSPVHFYSPRCTFPEFPGCFECDTSERLYQIAVNWHFFCSFVAGVCCVLFLLKLVVAWRIVVDELGNPTTSTPMGVVCIAMVCVFAGRGPVGEAIVIGTSCFHFLLAFWFLYTAIYRFRLWPDPGWFPNTVGISYAAVKTYLYFPMPGLVLLALCLVFFVITFFISVVRVALNKKISAPVAWIGLSAPSITLYAFSLVSQPTALKEALLESDSTLQLKNYEWMVEYYLPFQHFLMILSLVGLASAVHAVVTRWEAFKTKPFSPAHVAFCFPTLSHTNAIQAYRGSVDAFSSAPPGSPFKVALYCYWVFFLVVGTVLNIIFTIKYIRRLPAWTKLDTAGEEEPPAPEDTFVHDCGAHEMLEQPFVSPAVLQANEAGALVRVRRGTEDYRIHGPWRRTRKVSALGFDPTMDDEEFRLERAKLLDWVAKNAPRTRNRTMSNPLFLRGAEQGERDVYGTFAGVSGNARHKRSITSTGLPGV